MIYVSSDWHGVSLKKVIALLRKVDFGDDDYLFLLGDIIDRGSDSLELIKYIMNKPNIKLIRGNHEQMLLNSAFIFSENDSESNVEGARWLRIWQANGGEQTIAGLFSEHNKMRKRILEYLQETPLYDTVSVGGTDYLLVHAGLGVGEIDEIDKITEFSEHAFLWSRPYLSTKYSYKFITVLGHTPTCFYGEEYRGKILKTGTWIDVDTGVAMGLNPSLLRLDDLKEFYL